MYWELFSQSISMGLMSSIVSAGSVVLQYGINGLGTLTIAGHTAARKLFSFTSMPLISMANAGSTFVSQNRGAAQPERVRKGMRTMYLCSVVIMAAEVVLMQLFARQLVQLISGSSAPLVLENGARYLMWNAPFYAVLGVLLCTRYALQSLGQKVLPLFSSVIELVGKVIFVLVFIPRYAYNAVILCEPIIWCFMAAYLVAVYRREAKTERARTLSKKAHPRTARRAVRGCCVMIYDVFTMRKVFPRLMQSSSRSYSAGTSPMTFTFSSAGRSARTSWISPE